MDWQTIGGHAALAAFLIGLNLLAGKLSAWSRTSADQAPQERAHSTGGITRFPIGTAYRRCVVTLYSVPLALATALLAWLAIPYWFFIGPALLATALAAVSPGLDNRIVISSEGIEQRVLLGLVRRRIRWPNLGHSVVYGKEVEKKFKRTVQVLSKDGSTKIEHTHLHIDRRRFLSELRARTEVYDPPGK